MQPNWFDANPEMGQQVLDMLQQQTGRSLTPQELERAKSELGGAQLDPSKLGTFVQSLTGVASGAIQPPETLSSPGPSTLAPSTPAPTSGTAGQSGPSASPLFSDFAIPKYTAPTFKQAPAFQLPTLEEAQNEPGYQFGVQQGEKALMGSRAAQGLTRTGGTLKDILDYGRQAATQNYGNVANRAKGVYDTNYQTQYSDPNAWNFQNANADFYNQLAGNNQALNVGHTAFQDELAGANSQFQNNLAGSRFGLDVALARYAPQFAQWQTGNANAQRQAELTNNSDWAKYINEQNTFWTNQSNPFSRYLSLAQLGAGTA